MPRKKKPKGEKAERVLVTLEPDRLADLDFVADELTDGNRSGAVAMLAEEKAKRLRKPKGKKK